MEILFSKRQLQIKRAIGSVLLEEESGIIGQDFIVVDILKTLTNKLKICGVFHDLKVY